MLETKPIPSLHPCLTLFEREARSMSKKQLESTREGPKLDHKAKFTKSPHEVKEHKHGRSSAEDPSITSTRSDKHVSSNSRNHPRAELKTSGSSHSSSKPKHASNHIQNHISGKPHESDGKRKRSSEEEDDVWTEHTSSSGRTYFYNKKLDKSQWERPKGCVKRLKQDSTPSGSQKSKTSSTSSSSSKHPPSTHSHTPSSHSHTPSSHSHTPSSHSHTPFSHSHTGAGSKESSSHKSQSYRSHRDKEREKSHASRHHHHHSHQRGSRSRSHSMSLSPSKTVESKHGRERTTDKTHSKHVRVGSTHNTPTSSKSTHSSLTTSPSVGSTKTSMISPTTPTIPVTFSQTLSATQQIIDQTSILLEHQQKVIGRDNTTPVQPSTPVVQPFTQPFTPPASTHPHARKELFFPPSNGPYSQDLAASTPVTPVQCYPPVSGIIPLTSPQSSSFMDNMGLHPLQKALLLQNQFSQQQQIPIQTQSYVMLDPNAQPGVLMHPPQMPVASPFPPHLNTQQSHPNSPLPQSPHPNPSPAVQVFSAPTPMQQPVPYPMTAPPYLANTSPGVSVNLSFVPMASPTFQTPMSRLGYHTREGSRTADFPDSNSLDSLPPSQTSPELFSKSLAEGWSQFHEGLQKQVDACSNERLTRQTVECVHLSGRLAKTWLSVEASKVKTTSKDERIKSLRRLLTDVVQR